jgi:preprotein translocase subunit SecG
MFKKKKQAVSNEISVPKTWGEFLVRCVKAVPTTLFLAAAFILLCLVLSYVNILIQWHIFGI